MAGLHVDVMNMKEFQDILKVSIFLFSKSDEQTQLEALKMLEESRTLELIEKSDPP